MNKLYVICILLLGTMLLHAQAEDWLWAKQAGGTGSDYGYSIARDVAGNCYVTGSFQGTATFGSSLLTSSGDSDIFVAKHDTNGNWLWAKKAGGVNSDSGYSIATDAAGNLYVTGYFQSMVSFGSIPLISTGSYDIFIAKLDTNGNWLWAKKAGESATDSGFSLAADATGNIYVTGYFSGSVSFGSTLLTNHGNSQDIFVVKLDTNGNWLWATNAGGGNTDYGYSLAVDVAGNCYVTGTYYGDVISFGSIYLYGRGNFDIFVAKLGTNGNWLWAKTAGGTLNGNGRGIAIDADGNIYVTGFFNGTTSFDSISLSSIEASYFDIFVAKMDVNGNWLWVKQAGGTDSDYGKAVTTDDIGNTYIFGNFSGSANFGSYSLSSRGWDDIFVAKLDSTGNWLWVKQAGGSSSDAGYAIVTDATDNCYVTGNHNSISGFGNTTLDGIGGEDIFVAKIGTIQSFPLIITNPVTRLDCGNAYLGSSSVAQPLWIKNRGTANLQISSFSFYQSTARFSVQEGQLPYTVAAGDSLCIHLLFTPQTAGSVTDSLYISSNAQNQATYALKLLGNGEYVPPKPPTGLHTDINGYDLQLSWNAVTETIQNTPLTPDGYLVFYNGSANPDGQFYFLGFTQGLNYTHYHVGRYADYMFYRVLAVKHYNSKAYDFSRLLPGIPEAEVLELLRAEFCQSQ